MPSGRAPRPFVGYASVPALVAGKSQGLPDRPEGRNSDALALAVRGKPYELDLMALVVGKSLLGGEAGTAAAAQGHLPDHILNPHPPARVGGSEGRDLIGDLDFRVGAR